MKTNSNKAKEGSQNLDVRYDRARPPFFTCFSSLPARNTFPIFLKGKTVCLNGLTGLVLGSGFTDGDISSVVLLLLLSSIGVRTRSHQRANPKSL